MEAKNQKGTPDFKYELYFKFRGRAECIQRADRLGELLSWVYDRMSPEELPLFIKRRICIMGPNPREFEIREAK